MKNQKERSKRNSKWMTLLLSMALVAGLAAQPAYAEKESLAAETLSEQTTYSVEYCDLVATVEGGREGDVTFSGAASEDEGCFLIINTDKNVTISMKDGKTVTKDYIYVSSPTNTKEVRHITLDGVHIDRSGENISYQGVDLVTGLYPEQRAAMYAVYFQGTEVHYDSGVEYAGNLHLTLKGENTLVGAGSSNVKSTYSGYTPSKDDVLAGIRAMNLDIDGNGSLDVSGQEYGIYVKRNLYIAGGCIKAAKQSSNGREISCTNATIVGGCFANGSSGSVYGYPVYAGTVNRGAARLVELSANQDAATQTAYPYKVAYTADATAFLEGMVARKALSQKENGQDFAAAYDMALTDLDAFRAGSSVSVSYGMNYGFDMGQSQAIVTALQYDHPEYWWLWIDRTGPGATGATLILKNGYNASKFQSRSEAFEEAVTMVERASGVCASMTDYQKAYVLYQALAKWVSYDANFIDQSSGSAFLEKKAVCDGFAKAYILLLQRQGIPASYVEGWGTPVGSGNGGMHGWVIVSIDGSYYYCDPTWDCQGNAAVFTNFMKNATDFNGTSHEPLEDNMGYRLPTSAASSLGAPTNTITLTSGESSDGAFAIGSLSLISGSPVRVWVYPAEGKSVTTISIGETQKDGIETEEGNFYADFDAVSVNSQISAVFQSGSRMSSKLDAASRDISVKSGEELRASFSLKTKTGLAITDKTITVTLRANADSAFAEKSYTIETDSFGETTISIPDLPVGSYTLTAEFAGDESYRPAGLSISATVLENISYEVGDFVLSRTDGGILSEYSDYTYTEEYDAEDQKIDGSGLLTILSEKPITISMRDDVSVSHDRICNGATSGFVPKITLNGVIIDRSNIVVEGTAYESGKYNPSPEDKKLTSAIFSKEYTQNAIIYIEGYNSLIGAASSKADPNYATAYDPGYTNPYYSTIEQGGYTIKGSGKLDVKAYVSNKGAYIYGMDVTKLVVESGEINITSDAISNDDSQHPSQVRGFRTDTFIQRGGTFSITLGNDDFNTDVVSDVQAIEANNYTLTAGILDAEFHHKPLTKPIASYHSRYGINSNTIVCSGGEISISGFDTGIYASCGDGVSLANLKLLMENCSTPFSCTTSSSSGVPLSIESGFYGEGNVTENTVYGAPVLAGCTVKEVTEGGKTWYQVIDDRGLLVTGGTEGIDYVYANGEYTLLTETPMTFTMRGGKTATQNKIRASADLTYNITLDNVTIDRSAVTYDDIPTYKDDNIIHIEKGNLNLTLSGRNILKGSVMRGLYADGGKEYGSDNTGILVERGKLTLDGTGSLTITEPGSDFYSGGIVAFAYEQKGGSVDITAGKEGVGYYALQAVKQYKYNRGTTEPEGTGNILVSKGTLKAVVAGGQQTYSEYEYSSGIFAAGNLTIEDANVTAQMGDTTGSSSGVYLGGDLTVKGGSLTATGKNAGQLSAGIQCAGDLILTGGQITATGGKSGDSSIGYGIRVNADIIASGGKLTAIGGTSSYGSSIALEQLTDTGHVKFSGAEVALQGADADNSSYGGKFNGHMEISAGSVKAAGGKARDAISVGLSNDTDSEAIISGGTMIFTGADAALGSMGLSESSLSGGVDLKITGGTITASGGKVETPGSDPIAAGIYVFNQLQISGGKIKASGQVKAIDCSVATIRGGAFGEGDVAAKTVYGMKIASDCTMEKTADADYPYLVKDPKAQNPSGGDQGGSQDAGQGQGTDSKPPTDKPDTQEGQGQSGTDGGKTEEQKLPEVGTKESAQSGNGTYEVTGTTKTEDGKEAAALTYSEATGKDQKTSKLVIPSEVTLEDGSTGVVTEIGKKAFSGNKKLTDVTLPDSVETVKQEAFANCKKLKAATLGSTVSKVETKAFSGCTKLKKITVKTRKLTKKKVGKKAFSNIAKRAVVYYPKDMTKKELKNLKAAFKKGGAPKTITYRKSKK